MQQPKPPLKIKLIAICLIMMVSVVFLEVAVRLIISIPPETVPRHIGQFDEQLGWSLVPNSYGISTRTGQAVEYRINSKGLRDDETTYAKPDNSYRIVIIGDSHTFGFGVPMEQHFTQLLEGYFDNVEVINLGVSGYGVDQFYWSLEQEGLKYQPDLVIAVSLGYYGHRHMYTERFDAHKPKFEWDDDDLVVVNRLVKPKYSQWHELNRDIADYSQLYKVLAIGIPRLLGLAPMRVIVSDLDIKQAKDPVWMAQVHKTGDKILLKTRDLALAHKASFMIVTLDSQIEQAMTAEGITTLNIEQSLNNPLFRLSADLKHFNEAGNGIVAWLIAQELVTMKNFEN